MPGTSLYMGPDGSLVEVIVLDFEEEGCWCCDSRHDPVADPNTNGVTYCRTCWERGHRPQAFEDLGTGD